MGMRITVQKRLYWKVVSEDGLLKEPRKYGPVYDEKTINNYQGFETEEQAVQALRDFVSENDLWYAGNELTLVAIYKPIRDRLSE